MEAKLVRSSNPELLVHSWSESEDRLNPPVFIPKSYVTKASKGLKVIRSGKNKEISFYGGGHREGAITVYGDLKHDDMRAVAVYALEFEEMLLRTLGGKPRNIPYYLRFYADQAEFRRVAVRAGASNAMSYYDPRTRSIVMWFDQTLTHDNLQALVAHEFTHAYMDIVFDCTWPLWFAEGTAEYFQNFQWARDHAEPGALNEEQLAELEKARPIYINDFVKLGREAFYGQNFKALYAQAWTVVHFLFDYAPAMIQDLLRQKPINVAGLDSEWQGHLHAMMKRA